jgi:hypothetical protein
MDVNFPKLEEEVLERWKKEKAFEKSVARRRSPASAKASAGKQSLKLLKLKILS